MEKYIKFKTHREDDFARLLKKAFQAQGIYDKDKHDTIIMAIAPLFVRLEEARNEIANRGLLLEEESREGNIRYVRNPACDIEAVYIDRIRKALKDVGMYYEAKPKASASESEGDGDSLNALGNMIGGITRRDYRKPNA
jgi:hypothetical protein